MKDTKAIFLIVLITTKDRPQKLQRALQSISNQKLVPDVVIIISDCSNKFKILTNRVILQFENNLRIQHLKNRRSSNMSGSINTALAFVKNSHYNNDKTFIALLDDDDWWDDTYLLNCRNFVIDNKVEWVISGIIRHDEKYPNGVFQQIPDKIAVDDFLTTNPNIQNSNLFIKLEHLLFIGFDESLICTTDRDVCIRLLETSNIKYGFMNKHNVHHWAFNSEKRLSNPGSETKRLGLNQFYHKYKNRMNTNQIEKFKSRSYNLFKITIDDNI